MTHYNDIYEPMLDALDEDEKKFRDRAFKFLYQFFDEIDDDGFTNVRSTPERRKLAEELLKDHLMMDAYTNEIHSRWMTENYPEEWGQKVNWWAEGTSYEGIEDVFPRHFMELINALLNPKPGEELYKPYNVECGQGWLDTPCKHQETIQDCIECVCKCGHARDCGGY